MSQRVGVLLKGFGLAFATTLVVSLVLTSCGAGGTSESPEDFPSDTLTILVPFAPGGPTDSGTRAVAGYFEKELGQTVNVENIEGGSGAVATNELISSKPDGYTIGVIVPPATVAVPMIEDVGYSIDDFAPVANIIEIPSVLTVQADSPYGSAKALFKAAEQDPGSITVGTPGADASQAIELRRLNANYDPEVKVVPFEGNPQAVSNLLGGNLDATLLPASEDVLSQIEAGKFKPLAVTSGERADFLPDVPTLAELGYEDLTLSVSLIGFAVAEGTPQEVVDKLEATTREALEDPQVVEQIGKNYVKFMTGEKLKQRMDRIRETYKPILAE